ncbi:ATP-binding protein [Zavarzinella formosa]|uniref:ATP-binding protein n=1 Tax=Zavarzinella formosa TaxID=360055 RepID=UPI0002D4988B|nr:ATP-binding protein [Zavarzinella formosa]
MTINMGQHHVIPSDLEAARTLQEAIEVAVKPFFEESEAFAIKMAVEESLVNAIKHGNQMDPSKFVRVEYDVSPEEVQVHITDEGPGFNPEDVPDPTAPENLERPCGRGLLLIRYYMSDVSFRNNGRTIVLTKRRKK